MKTRNKFYRIGALVLALALMFSNISFPTRGFVSHAEGAEDRIYLEFAQTEFTYTGSSIAMPFTLHATDENGAALTSLNISYEVSSSTVTSFTTVKDESLTNKKDGYNTNVKKAKLIGSYTIDWKISKDGSELAAGSTPVKIVPRSDTTVVDVALIPQTLDYTGKSQQVYARVIDENGNVITSGTADNTGVEASKISYTWSKFSVSPTPDTVYTEGTTRYFKATNVGTYTVDYAVTLTNGNAYFVGDDGEPTLTKTGTLTFEMQKASVKNVTVTFGSSSSSSQWTYGAATKEPTTKGTIGAAAAATTFTKGTQVTYDYKPIDADDSAYRTYDTSKLIPAGKYVLRAKILETANYGETTQTVNFEVTKKALSLTTTKQTIDNYRTEPNQKSFTTATLVSGDKVDKVTIHADLASKKLVFDQSEGSTVIVNAAGEDVTDCYEITYKSTGTLTITKVAVTVTPVKQSLAVNDEPQQGAAYYTVSGLLEGDSVDATIAAKYATSATDNDTVTLSATVNSITDSEGNDVSAYYTVKNETVEDNASKATIRYTIDESKLTVTYDGNTHSPLDKGLINIESPSNAKVSFSKTENGTYSTTAGDTNSLKEPKTQDYYIKITANGYETVGPLKITMRVAGKDMSQYVSVSEEDNTFYFTKTNNTPVPRGLTVKRTSVAKDATIMYHKEGVTNWVTTCPTFSAVGEYKIYYKLEKTGYETIEGEGKLVIKMADMSSGITTTDVVEPWTKVDGKVKAYKITVTKSGDALNATINYRTDESEEWSATNPTFTEVGTHTVYYRATQTGYETVTGVATVTITKRDITPTLTFGGTDAGWVYGKVYDSPTSTTQRPSVSGNYDDGKVVFEYKPKDADESAYREYNAANAPTEIVPGEYMLRATIKETEHCNEGTIAKEFTVKKATLTITPDSGQFKIYGGDDPTLTYQVTGWVGNDAETIGLTGQLSRENATVQNAGTYAITRGTLAVEKYYDLAFTTYVRTFTIKPYTLNVTAENQTVEIGEKISESVDEVTFTDENGNEVTTFPYDDTPVLTLTGDTSTKTTTDTGRLLTLSEVKFLSGSDHSTDVTANYKITKTNARLYVVEPGEKSITGATIKLLFDKQELSAQNSASVEQKIQSVEVNGRTLKRGTDYTIDASTPLIHSEAGVYSVKINGVGLYTGSAESAQYQILAPEAPTLTVKEDTNVWDRLVSVITFGTLRSKVEQITVSAFDEGSGMKGIWYFLSSSELTAEELVSEDIAWENYESPFDVFREGNLVVYAKAMDLVGNTTYVSSDGMVIDATRPTITGVENDGTYCGEARFTVSDVRDGDDVTAEVTVKNGDSLVTPDTDGTYVIKAAADTQIITATDKAGNETKIAVNVKEHSFSDYVSDGNATIFADGTKTAMCSNCEKAKDTIVDIGSKLEAPTLMMEGWTEGQEHNEPKLEGDFGEDIRVTYDYKSMAADEDAYTSEMPEEAGCYTVRATLTGTKPDEEMRLEKDFIIFYEVQVGSQTTENSDELESTADVKTTETVLLQDILSEEDISEAIKAGELPTVYVDVKKQEGDDVNKYEENAIEEVTKKFEEQAEDDTTDDATKLTTMVAATWDISILKRMGGNEEKVIESQKELSFTLAIPTEYINTDRTVERTFYIVRIHEGVASVLDATLTGTEITFSSNQFSYYMLVYVDKKIESGSTTPSGSETSSGGTTSSGGSTSSSSSTTSSGSAMTSGGTTSGNNKASSGSTTSSSSATPSGNTTSSGSTAPSDNATGNSGKTESSSAVTSDSSVAPSGSASLRENTASGGVTPSGTDTATNTMTSADAEQNDITDHLSEEIITADADTETGSDEEEVADGEGAILMASEETESHAMIYVLLAIVTVVIGAMVIVMLYGRRKWTT